MEKNNYKRNNEKGAITLYVILACLFFVFILAGVYMSSLNKLQVQEKEVKQIEENYKRQIDRIEEIYDSMVDKVEVTLTASTLDWAREVTLTGHGMTEELEIVAYTFNQKSNNEEIIETEWQKINEQGTYEITRKKENVTENGTYYFWVKVIGSNNEEKSYKSNPIEITKIDREEPNVGSLIAKEDNSEGEEYAFDTWTDKSIYVEKVDGSDIEPGSGHKRTTMTILKNGLSVEEWTEIEGTVILEESGVYTATVTTEDNVGNKVTSSNYMIKIDKIVPVLALKHNGPDGPDYEVGTWTKDDLYGEITIDTSGTGKTLEKYQYSYNGIKWDDISEEVIQTSIDYTTTFPLGGDKPDWITGPINANDTYYFEVQEDGKLKNNNNDAKNNTNKYNNTTANSYFEIDLTQFPEATLNITLDTTISSESNCDWGYATITESATAPAYNSTTGRFIYVSGTTQATNPKTTITGGKKYYLHIGYRKDGSGYRNQDTFTINSIKLKSDKLRDLINFYDYTKENNKVTFKLKDEIEKEIYVRAVYTGENNVSRSGNSTSIKIDKTAPIVESSTIEVLSKTEAKANIKVKEEASGFKGYYLIEKLSDDIEITNPTEASNWTEMISKEFTLENLKTNTTYYIWLIDNVGNISEKQEIKIDNVNYEVDGNIYTVTLEEAIAKAQEGSTIKLLNYYIDESVATFNKNITFDIQGNTLTRDKTITINTGKTVEITGTGKITTRETQVNTITNNGTLTISNEVTIENRSTNTNNAPIYTNNNSSITNINDNVTISGYYKGIYNNGGTVNINGGYIEATNQNSSAYVIYNYYSSSKLYINDGEIKGYNGIYNYISSALVEMTGGKVVGTGADGIYASGITNIYGGRIEGKTYGIKGRATNKVTIGRQEDELSTTIPAIYGGNYGIYMYNTTYNFNFYNGVIIHNTKDTAYNGVANLRENHMTYTYIDYDIEQKYCTILTPTVGNITMEATPPNEIFTNENVTVKITYPQGEGITREYSEDGVEWKQAEQYVQEVIVTENKTIYARRVNETGIIVEETQLEVTNIDKEAPTVTVEPTKTKYGVLEENDTVEIPITISATDTGVSGLDKVQYAWAKQGEEVNYTDFSNEITINKENLKIGTYNLYLNVTDRAGNKTELTQIRYIVEIQEPVAQIGEQKYLTIQDAVEACSKEAGEEQTTITILKNTDEEFSTYEGQNIIIDLKGKIIGSSSTETPICTNSGTLQIKDNSTEQTGKLESLNGTAIQNKGTITIGDNSNEIDFENPTIYGKKIGIKNEGTLNYYDGQIQGTAPIQGKVTQTPEEYGPVTTGYENGITTVQLGIVNGYVARIEWVYYTDLQQAVDATKLYQNNNRDTVTILQNIQLHEILEISGTKDIILDLNGYELTIVSGKDRVINNNGNLEITDTSVKKVGTVSIYGSNSNAIYNASTGRIEVSGGTVSNSGSGYGDRYGIYNYSTGSIKVSGGTVNSNDKGICNASTGSIEVSDGTVSSKRYGIDNLRTGSVTVSGGTVNSNTSYGIYNASKGRVEVSGGTVDGSSSGIYNASTGSIKVSGGTVNSNNTYGIYNIGTGSIEVRGGTINGGSYGIYNTSEGSIIIGNKEIEISKENLIIQGRYNIGVYNKLGSIDYYNGIIQGRYLALEGNITKIREGYKIQEDAIDNYDSIYLVKNNNKEYIAQIEEKKYYTLKEAIESIEENEQKTIQILRNFELEEEKTVEFNKNIILDLNGHIITNKYYRIENTGKLTIIDTTEEKLGKIDCINTIIGINNTKSGSIEVIGGTVSSSDSICSSSNNDSYGIYNAGTGSITVSGGTVSSDDASDSYGIYNANTGIVKVTGGTVSSSNSRSGSVSIKSYGIYNRSTGSVTVSGGKVSSSSDTSRNSSSYGINNESTGNVIVSEGKVSSSSDSYSHGIRNNSTGSVTVEGGTVSSSSSKDNYGYGISNNSTGSITVTEGTISGKRYGIYNNGKGRVEVIGGAVSSSSYNSSGIYNLGTGSIIIGTKGDGMVSQKEPYIKGEYTGTSTGYYGYGIYNTKGNLYFYDGIIEGTTKAVYDTITEKEENTEFDYNEDETVLKLTTTVTEVAQIVGGEKYISLQEAINAVGTEPTTIEILRNVTYTNQDEIITIPNNKNIKLDLKGYRIVSAILETIIQNKGKLEIIDTSENKTGIVISTTENTIKNQSEAELIISGGTIENRTEQSIYNEGNVEISGGTVSSSGNGGDSYGIYNTSTGRVEVSGGTVSSSGNGSDSYGIYNASEGNVIVSGGIVRSSSNSDSYGIYNASTGRVEATGGTVRGRIRNL